MFSFLGAISLAQCMLSGIKLLSPGANKEFYMPLFISGLINSILFFKLAKNEKDLKFLWEIAKQHGYKKPSEQKPDIYVQNSDIKQDDE